VLFYLTFEFTIVSSLPLMSEILPSARATLLAANMALISLGRAAGAWLAPRFFGLGASQTILYNALAAWVSTYRCWRWRLRRVENR
jgi:predicted MFS family arabinose efflux permease